MRDRLQGITADLTGGLVVLRRLGGERDVEDCLYLGQGAFRELALEHLVDRRFGQVVADQILAREAMGIEVTLDRGRDCQPLALGLQQCLMFRHAGPRQTVAKVSIFSQILARVDSARRSASTD
jgi:hypothetical protein